MSSSLTRAIALASTVVVLSGVLPGVLAATPATAAPVVPAASGSPGPYGSGIAPDLGPDTAGGARATTHDDAVIAALVAILRGLFRR